MALNKFQWLMCHKTKPNILFVSIISCLSSITLLFKDF